MPAGNLKNTLYQLALPILGLRSPIASVQGGSDDENAVSYTHLTLPTIRLV